jgi:NAD(P)-dependent dehydrogenase (short-subunit alcohol dehydrogenase family)
MTNTSSDFNRRSAVVTGGSKGIGRGFMEAFGRGGATSACTYRPEDESVCDLLAWT